jgi:hypothetical protein
MMTGDFEEGPMSESSGAPREFDTEPPGLEEIAADLHDDEGVDDRRVVLAAEGDALVVGGSVATQEEADRALLVAERSGAQVVDRLQIDPALREGIEEPSRGEEIEPLEDEVLVGGTDMLAGPDTEFTDDLQASRDENEPLDPPEEPLFPSTQGEARNAEPWEVEEDADPELDVDLDDVTEDDRPAAADLTEQDLREAAEGRPLPPLDPDLDATAEDLDPATGPGGVDELGDSPREP